MAVDIPEVVQGFADAHVVQEGEAPVRELLLRKAQASPGQHEFVIVVVVSQTVHEVD